MSRKSRRPKIDPSVAFATMGHLPAQEIQRRITSSDIESFWDQKRAYFRQLGSDLGIVPGQGTENGYRAGLDAADPNNRFMRYRVGMGGSGDAHMYHQKLWWVRETSRHMVLNDDLVGQMLMRLADNIVQSDGFRLVMQTSDTGFNKEFEARMDEWGSDPRQCDFYGERTWAQMQWLGQFQIEQDGDIFALPIDNGSLQFIEAERCFTYRGQDAHNYLGLSFSEQGEVVGYRFTPTPLSPWQIQYVGPTEYIARWDEDGELQVFHLHDARRFTQHRGLPWLVAAMIKMGMLDDIQFAMLVRAQSCASHAAFIKRTQPIAGPPPQIGQRGTPIVTPAADGSEQLVSSDALKYGQWTALPYGYEVDEFSPSIPNPEFFPHVQQTVRQLGAVVSMPLEMVLLDASQTNFSGWRGAMDQARMSFRRWQKQLAGQLHRPTQRWLARRWAYDMGTTARRMLATGEIFAHKWVPPAWPYINPKEDAEAGALLVSTGQASPRGLASSRGEDFDDIVTETIADRSKALRAAIKEAESIKEATGWTVDPAIILGWDLPANSALISQVDAQQNANGGQVAPGDDPEDSPNPPPSPAKPSPVPAPTNPRPARKGPA